MLGRHSRLALPGTKALHAVRFGCQLAQQLLLLAKQVSRIHAPGFGPTLSHPLARSGVEPERRR